MSDYFQKKSIPFFWLVSPYDKPDDLSKYLENNGYINTMNSVAMYFDLDKWGGRAIPSNLQIIQAKDEKTLREFALIMTNDEASCTKYYEWIASVLTDDDPIEYFVGYVNDKPVVCGSSCYFAQLAGLNDLATVPGERNKGYAKVMQYYQLERAKEFGYHIAVLQAVHESYLLYKKIGYEKCETFRKFKLR